MPIYMGIFKKQNVLDPKFRGGVTAEGFEGWIELESAQLGTYRNVTNATGGGANREASQPGIREIVITRYQDALSTTLFQEFLAGEAKLVVIAFVKDGKAFMAFVLQDTIVSSYNIGGSGGSGSDKPIEILSLNFTMITYDRSPKSPNITPSAMNDLMNQQATRDPGSGLVARPARRR